MEGPACVAAFRREYMADTYNPAYNLDSGGSSAEEMSSSSMRYQSLQCTEPPAANLWEGSTWSQQLKSSSSTANMNVRSSGSSSSSLLSEYSKQQLQGFSQQQQQQADLVSTTAWAPGSGSLLSQASTTGSATPYMDHIRQSTANGGNELYGLFSPTRYNSPPDNIMSRMPARMDSSAISSGRRAGAAMFGNHSCEIGKAYEGFSPHLSSFHSNGSSKAVAENSLQFPISPESPISPLDLNSVIQQFAMKRHPEAAWAEARFGSAENFSKGNINTHKEIQPLGVPSADTTATTTNNNNNHLVSDELQFARRTLFSENAMSISEGYNNKHHHKSVTAVSSGEISSQAYLDILAKKNNGAAGTAASAFAVLSNESISRFDASSSFELPPSSTSSGWSQQFQELPSSSALSALNSLPSRVHCPGPEISVSVAGLGRAAAASLTVQRPQVDSSQTSFSVTTSGSSIFDTSARIVDQPKITKVTTNPGKRKAATLELKTIDDHQDSSCTGGVTLLQKGSKASENNNAGVQHKKSSAAALGRVEPPAFTSAANYSATQTVEVIAAGPALNTNGKPRARRGSATDPQSVYARNRRKKIDERLKTLQNLVPNGSKVDIVTMLDEAFNYVKFLELQVELLKSDDLWVYATPNRYNDVLS